MKTIQLLFDRIIIVFKIILNFFQKRRWLYVSINVLLALSMMIFLYYYVSKDISTIANLKIFIDFKYLGLCIVLLGTNYWIFIIVWHLLLKQFGINTSFLTNASYYSYSQIVKILPTPAWFIGGRIFLYNKIGIPKRLVMALTVIETITHAIIGIVILLLLHNQPRNPFSWLFSFSLLLLIWIGFNNLDFSRYINLPNTCKKYKPNFSLIIILLFIFTWVLSLPFIIYLVKSIIPTNQFSIIELWRIWIFSSIASYIAMFTLGGIGLLREFTLSLLLSPIITPPLAILIAALTRIIITISNVLWPIIFIFIESIDKKCRVVVDN